MHLLINPLCPHFPPPSSSSLCLSLCPSAVFSAADLEGQISHISYLLLGMFVFLCLLVHHCLGRLRCRRRIIVDDHIEFLLPQKNTFKNTNFFGNDGSSMTNTEGNTADGCQRASLMVCRCHMVKTAISLSQDAAHPSWTARLISAFSFLVSEWDSDHKKN